MLTTPKLTQIQELIAGSSREELVWLSGYLAGVAAGQGQATTGSQAVPALSTPAAPTVNKITIAYGTETGNSKKLASDFAAKAKKKGINARLIGLEQYRLGDLTKEEYFFAVISTQGDGEPPAAAKKFYDHIHQGSLKLERLKYGVLALGDTSYPLFCKAGEDVDHQLNKAGGQRIVALEKCDTDYDSQAGKWFETVLQQLSTSGGASAPAAAPATAARPTGKKTYTGTVLANINLNDRGSSKKTHHLEIAAEGVDYLPGDALGLVPENPAATVEAILALTGADPNRKLTIRQEEATIGHLLRKRLNIVYLPERVVKKYAAIVQQDIPETRIGLLDLLKIYPVKDAAQFHEVISILEPTAPRLYSISSSPEAHSGEIHLTVTRDSFSVNGETKHGLCSDLLSQLSADGSLDFYIHRNSQFRLPAEDKDVIMIGPGTGIAPFRSFLAHRDSQGASGRNWLFFGDQHFTTDFLYQTDLQNWMQTGVLTRLNTAFSRDQKEKVYVQHKMRREAAELYRWLEDGAYVYVCGTKEPMSVDVEAALLEIIKEEGKKTQSQAEAWLDELKEAGRYVKDVY
ncbi:MAG: flavodoxin domain-containing protein [Bacteroidetes bacterium]|nr:flavodoxin domain-containing protein [Bacteroidota bacterium]